MIRVGSNGRVRRTMCTSTRAPPLLVEASPPPWAFCNQIPSYPVCDRSSSAPRWHRPRRAPSETRHARRPSSSNTPPTRTPRASTATPSRGSCAWWRRRWARRLSWSHGCSSPEGREDATLARSHILSILAVEPFATGTCRYLQQSFLPKRRALTSGAGHHCLQAAPSRSAVGVGTLRPRPPASLCVFGATRGTRVFGAHTYWPERPSDTCWRLFVCLLPLLCTQVDPMEPPKHKHKKVPRAPADDPVPVLHSPPRKVGNPWCLLRVFFLVAGLD